MVLEDAPARYSKTITEFFCREDGMMSFCCTLHPLDPRFAESLEKSILGHKSDWSHLWLNYRQKKIINRVNQRIKACLSDLMGEVSGYCAEIHQSGRPL